MTTRALFPSTVKTFIDKVDYRDTVLAEHVNALQAEVTAVERALGTRVTTSAGFTGAFDAVTTVWSAEAGGLGARLQNIEYGLRADSHSQYVRRSAQTDNIISPAAGTTVALTVNGHPSQSVDLVRIGNAKVDKDSHVYSAGVRVATLTGAEALTNKTISGASNTFVAVPATAVTTGAQNIKQYVDARPTIIYSTDLPDAVALGLPPGSKWIDAASNPAASDVDAKTELKAIVAAAPTYAAFQTAIAAW